MKTVLEVIGATAEYFRKHGVDSPRLNAEHLLAHALGKKRLDLYMEFDRPLGEAELAPLREPVRKRALGHPLQHLLGTVEFFGAEFLCDPRALIPRPETEQLVAMLAARPAPARIVDVGTGSGVIALSLARRFAEARVEATDLDAGALALARENAARLGMENRVTFAQGDLLDPVGPGLDWVVANLPYIESSALPALQREVGHDPATALDGGPDGLDLIRRLLPAANEKIVPGGMLALEIGAGQSTEVTRLMEQTGFPQTEIAEDHQGVARFAFGTHG